MNVNVEYRPVQGMKKKTIKAVLRKKFNEWVDNIRSSDVREAVKKNSIITGGSIASMLLGEQVSDFDIYFTDADTAETVARHYVEEFKSDPPPRFARKHNGSIPVKVWRDNEVSPPRIKVVVQSAGITGENDDGDYQYFEQSPDPDATDAGEYAEQATDVAQHESGDDTKPKYRPVFLSGNAISLSEKVQLVFRFYGQPDEIHENYDFVHCTNYWHSGEDKLVLRPEAMEALLARELRYVGSKYPLCSFIRTRKFVARGWRINAGQFLKMAWHLNALKLSDPDVLEEQLTGVDAAYFEEVLRLLRERMNETGQKEVDATYLMQVIDRIF